MTIRLYGSTCFVRPQVENGERLGPVGARIVVEVFVGLLQGDRTSYLSHDPDWEPFLPTVIRQALARTSG